MYIEGINTNYNIFAIKYSAKVWQHFNLSERVKVFLWMEKCINIDFVIYELRCIDNNNEMILGME